MSDDELIEKMARAIVQSFFDIGHNIYYENPETLRTVSLAAKTALNVCRPIIEEPLRDENEKLRKALRPYVDKYHWDIKHYDEVMSYGSLKAHDFYAAAAALGETDD